MDACVVEASIKLTLAPFLIRFSALSLIHSKPTEKKAMDMGIRRLPKVTNRIMLVPSLSVWPRRYLRVLS